MPLGMSSVLRPLAAVGVLAALVTTVYARPLKTVGVEASSTYPAAADVNYEARNTTDRKQSTMWSEGAEGSGLGSWVRYDLEGTPKVTGLRIWGGSFYSGTQWEANNRVKELELSFSDGSTQVVTLKDEMVSQYVPIDKPVNTSSVKLKVKSVYSGSAYTDTVLSEVVIYDDSMDDRVPVKAFKASTTYPADADGNYDPANMNDLVVDSMWCEGDKGDGTGQWVELSFEKPTTLKAMELVNGNGYGLTFWQKGNRAVQVTASFSDGSTQVLGIKDSMLVQTVPLQPVTTDRVKLTFTQVKAGKEFNDLCISELVFKQ